MLHDTLHRRGQFAVVRGFVIIVSRSTATVHDLPITVPQYLCHARGTVIIVPNISGQFSTGFTRCYFYSGIFFVYLSSLCFFFFMLSGLDLG